MLFGYYDVVLCLDSLLRCSMHLVTQMENAGLLVVLVENTLMTQRERHKCETRS